MRRLRIDHLTEYRYSAAVTLLPHRLMLRPRASYNVRVSAVSLDISPAHSVRYRRDPLDNTVALVDFLEVTSELRIATSFVVEHYEDNPLDFLVEELAVYYPFRYRTEELPDLEPFLVPVWPEESNAVRGWLGKTLPATQGLQTYALLEQLNHAVHGLRYEIREEPGVQSPARTLSRGTGSCRDLAALFMEAARQLGLASRFASGYQTTSPGADYGSTHAWVEVYLPGPGWKGFDPTAGSLTGNQHIAVAVARHPEAVPPVAGSFVGPQSVTSTMRVSVRAHDVTVAQA